MPGIIPLDFQSAKSKDNTEFSNNFSNDFSNDDINEIYPILTFLSDMQLSPTEIKELVRDDNRPKLNHLLEQSKLLSPQDSRKLFF